MTEKGNTLASNRKNPSANRNDWTDDQSSYNTVNLASQKHKKGRAMFTAENSQRDLQRAGLKPIW